MQSQTDSRTPLFRPEVVDRTGFEGEILLFRSVPATVLTILFTLVGAAIAIFIASFTYTRQATATGVLLPIEGLVLVRASAVQTGVITNRLAREGQQVRTGDVLFTLTSERSGAAGSTTESTVADALRFRRQSIEREQMQLQAQLEQRVDSARKRLAAIQAESSRISKQISIQSQRVALAESSLARNSELRTSGFVSAAQLQDKQADLLDQRQRSADLERAQAVLAREAASVESDMSDLQIQSRRDMAALERSLAAIDQDLAENESRRDITIRASRDGTVASIQIEQGQSVAANQPLATIVPEKSALEAELQVPSRSVGFVKPGMEVVLRYGAFPFQKFGHAHGRVREVSGTPIRIGEALEPTYRIRVTLQKQTFAAHGEEQPLKPGAAVDASITLETRKLYEWLLDPIYSVKERM